MREFSSRSGIIRNSFPVLTLTQPALDCSIRIGGLRYRINAMGLIARCQFAHHRWPRFRHASGVFFFAIGLWLTAFASERAGAQSPLSTVANSDLVDHPSITLAPSRASRVGRFLGGRTLAGNVSAARAMVAARQQHAAML